MGDVGGVLSGDDGGVDGLEESDGWGVVMGGLDCGDESEGGELREEEVPTWCLLEDLLNGEVSFLIALWDLVLGIHCNKRDKVRKDTNKQN